MRSTQEPRQPGRSREAYPTSSSVRLQLSQWEHGESLQQLVYADANAPPTLPPMQPSAQPPMPPPTQPPPTQPGNPVRRRGRPPGSKNKPKPVIPAKRTEDQEIGDYHLSFWKAVSLSRPIHARTTFIFGRR
ncbi:hypothetical protein F4804DRAFT_280161 [Jackrogersella minutella]|nr:hypothetical protein F4804DRAFT_280161 [Jackrogersella minutella]